MNLRRFKLITIPILGITLNLLVALGICFFVPPTKFDFTPSERPVSYMDSLVKNHDWSIEPTPKHFSSELGYRVSHVFGGLKSDSYQRGEVRYYPPYEFGYVEVGFPFICLNGEVKRRNNQVYETHGAITLEENMIPYMTVIPLRPIWMPFFVNCLIWSLFVFLLFVIYRFIKAQNGQTR